MWNHEVIKDLKEIKPYNSEAGDRLNFYCDTLKTSINFYLGYSSSVMKQIDPNAIPSDYFSILKFPYNKITIQVADIFYKINIKARAILILCQYDGYWSFDLLMTVNNDFWFPIPIRGWVKTKDESNKADIILTPLKTGETKEYKCFEDAPLHRMIFEPLYDPDTINEEDHQMMTDAFKLATYNLVGSMLLINSPSVYIQTIKPSEKLNKKRIRKNKIPHSEYRVLTIKAFNKKTNTENIIQLDKLDAENRLHMCRGHWKLYKEKPLFGKITGLYWWNPTVRGNKDLGIIDKDYEVIE
ncbi:hypothetical protein M0R04_09335 [Candidatus Dojkabacteria bacterium]|jgi:hypothetical protein|nr:hypothetical protein [Candidatus Dojkabacteria bacterium]